MSQRRTSRNQPHLPYLYMPDTDDVTLRNSFTLKHLPPTSHTPQSRYVRTYLFFFSTTVISSITSIAIYIIHSLRHRHRLRHSKPKSHTSPTQNFKLSIHPVRELVAGCFRLEIQDSQAASGRGGVANNDGGLPYYQSWVISQGRRSWCCSVGRWASSYGGGLCLLFISRIYKSGKIR